MTARRELQLAVVLCLVGALLVLWALGQDWIVTVDSTDLTIAGTRTTVAGSELAMAARPLGYVGLAAVVALAATRRGGRVLVGLVVLGAGVGVVLDVADELSREHLTSVRWPWVAVAGGVVLALAGLLVVVRGRRWPALGRAYDAPSAAAAQPVGDKAVWDALDRGDDPTA